jgi:hypothetical protein
MLDSGTDFPAPAHITPWLEREWLHDRRSDWANQPLTPPKPYGQLVAEEIPLLLERQALLRDNPALAFRRAAIVREMDLELSGYLLPLGASNAGGFDAMERLITTVADLTSEIGLRYKDRFDVLRPHELDARIQPFIAVPWHASYPSNHAFQSRAIALIISRTIPEHPGIPALFRSCDDIARNREWAGVHYPSDSAAGQELARLCLPVLEDVLQHQMQAAREEWLG